MFIKGKSSTQSNVTNCPVAKEKATKLQFKKKKLFEIYDQRLSCDLVELVDYSSVKL